MKRSLVRWLAFAACLMIFNAIPADAATTTTELQVVAMAHDAFALTAAAPSASRPLVIDSAPTVTIMVTAMSKTLEVTLVSPNGTRRKVGDPDTATFTSGMLPDPNNPNSAGANYAIVLDQPVSGTYTLEVTETAPIAARREVVVNTLFENSTRALLLGGGETYPAGGSIRLAAVVMDSLGKVRNLTITARLFRPNDGTFAPVAVSFRDDGTSGDPTAGDGIYTALVSPGAGTYEVEASIGGVAASGAFRRTATASFDVVPRRVQITGTFTERTADTNGDGLINRIAIAPRANVLEAGLYDVVVRLRASNGNFIQRSARAGLIGDSAPEVWFETEDLTRDLAVNGPWAVEMVTFQHSTGVPGDIRYDLGNTAAYQLDNFQRPRLRIVGGSSTGVDTNGNGRFDRLDVTLQIGVDFAGSYTYSGSLRDRNGADLGFRTGSRFLSAGAQTITLSFDGHTIGENGVDGPYSLVNFLMFGGNHSIDAAVAFTTPAYRASQFEGFVGDTTPPVLSVSVDPAVLWPVNHQMIEITPAIEVSDDLDPSPVVDLVSITSNEGDDVRGDGNTSNDILIDNGKIFLRAERSALGEGRTYTITWRARDQAGNSSLASATVTVPHDRGK